MAATVTTVPTPPRNHITAVVAIAILLVGAALTAIVWGMGAPLQVSVDGAERTVPQGTTVADLAAARYTHAHTGVLYSVNGGIANAHGGSAPNYARNGRQVLDSQRVYAGDIIVSTDGDDIVERSVTARVSVDPTATIQGAGPILKMVRPGKPGTAVVTKGAVSGQIVSTKVIVPAENIILVASAPTSTDKLVALTFDDGPWPGSTLKIVEILKREGVPGTFFELGEQVKRTPRISAAVVAAGNVVANHSWSHPFMTKMKPPAIRKQITDTATAIKDATGVAPTWFRPPYGAINRNVWAQAKVTREGVVLWDVDSRDWTRPGPAKIVQNVTSGMGRASIVLMHDGGGDRSQTIAALPQVISWLKTHGYHFVTLAQLQAVR
jgi:peptidoglycan/xylan/chitin deacetylase (PgdA/CDA1 family)/sulfur carrier protein ThiS